MFRTRHFFYYTLIGVIFTMSISGRHSYQKGYNRAQQQCTATPDTCHLMIQK